MVEPLTLDLGYRFHGIDIVRQAALGRLAPPGNLCVRLLSHLQRVVDFDP